MAARRLALVIGTSDYADAGFPPLASAAHDVSLMAEVLQALGGFAVTSLLNEPWYKLQAEVARFFAGKARDDVLLLYFSGHGKRDPDDGRLYFVAHDTEADNLRGTALAADFLRAEMIRPGGSRRQIVILDCCHSGGFSLGAKGDANADLATALETTGKGRIVLAASAPHEQAWEGNKFLAGLENSLFTHCLVEGLQTGAASREGGGQVTVQEAFTYACQKVTEIAAERQTPKMIGEWEGAEPILARNPRPPALPPDLQQALAASDKYTRLGALTQLGQLLRSPDPKLARAARQRLEDLRADDTQPRYVYDAVVAALDQAPPPSQPRPHVSLSDAETRRKQEEKQKRQLTEQKAAEAAARHKEEDEEHQREALLLRLSAEVVMEFVRVPAGEFLMGSTDADSDASDAEKPQHTVYLAEYLIGKYPVTVAQFSAFVKTTGYKCEPRALRDLTKFGAHPANCVSWNDAVAFCQWASQAGAAAMSAPGLRRVRLPTEAEWEKAARGTDGRKYPWGNSAPTRQHCNFGTNSSDTTRVGKYSPLGDSPYGCADMAGNVWEWVADWYAENYYANLPARNPRGPASGEGRVLRGGSSFFEARYVRAAYRFGSAPVNQYVNYGFRCARETAS